MTAGTAGPSLATNKRRKRPRASREEAAQLVGPTAGPAGQPDLRRSCPGRGGV